MFRLIDNLLNSITMYRVVLYGLIVIVAASLLFGFTGLLGYSGVSLLTSLVVLLATCYITNIFCSWLLKVPANIESTPITALILYCILLPPITAHDTAILVASGVLAVASKYILAINRKHIFNPVAIALVLTNLGGSANSFWWVGSEIMLPVVAIVGFLILKKIRRFRLFFSFFFAAVFVIFEYGFFQKSSFLELSTEIFTSWPVIFFGTIMLTEPFTMPARRNMQILYGILVGVLFGIQFRWGPLYMTPELALVLGNIFSFIVNPKGKIMLTLKEKKQIAPGLYHFIFNTDRPILFEAGQYLEWTLPHKKSDSRGIRRYFTIASAPSENTVELGVKIPEKSSSFKKALLSLTPQTPMVASQLAGDFTLPDDATKNIICIAGGIGITPFRSMIKDLVNKKNNRNVTLLYVSSTNDFAYTDLFKEAQKYGVNTIYIITNNNNVPPNWKGETGYITPDMLKKYAPEYQNAVFYLSGPNAMVHAYQSLLAKLRIPKGRIVTDYFPGF